MRIDPNDKGTWPKDTEYHHGYVLQVDESKAKNTRFYRVMYRVWNKAPWNYDDKMPELEIENYHPTLYDGEYHHASPLYCQCKTIYPCDPSGWIAVVDGLPEDGTEADDSSHVLLSAFRFYEGSDREREVGFINDGVWHYSDGTALIKWPIVTHWMPLPALPGESK